MGGTGAPTVSFVIPARNEAAYLPATLESIRQLETATSYEYIVVDGTERGYDVQPGARQAVSDRRLSGRVGRNVGSTDRT